MKILLATWMWPFTASYNQQTVETPNAQYDYIVVGGSSHLIFLSFLNVGLTFHLFHQAEMLDVFLHVSAKITIRPLCSLKKAMQVIRQTSIHIHAL